MHNLAKCCSRLTVGNADNKPYTCVTACETTNLMTHPLTYLFINIWQKSHKHVVVADYMPMRVTHPMNHPSYVGHSKPLYTAVFES